MTHDATKMVKAVECRWCDEPFSEADPQSPIGAPMHHDCLLRMVVGGVNHQTGRCTCCGGTEPPDPPSLSKREAAALAARRYYATRATDVTSRPKAPAPPSPDPH